MRDSKSLRIEASRAGVTQLVEYLLPNESVTFAGGLALRMTRTANLLHMTHDLGTRDDAQS